MSIFLPFLIFLTFSPYYIAGNDEVRWEDTVHIDDDSLVEARVCIMKPFSDSENGYLYANKKTSDYTTKHPRTQEVLERKEFVELDPKFAFFTIPISGTNKIYSGTKWKLIPASEIGEDAYEIENVESKQVLLTKGEGRQLKPDDYIYEKRRIVFTENRKPNRDPAAVWIIRKHNGLYYIKNHSTSEFLYRRSV